MSGILIGAIIGAAVGLGLALVQRRKRLTENSDAAAQHSRLLEDDRRILNLQIGDIIEHMGESYIIDAALLYDEEGTVWKTYLLGGGSNGQDRWLSVEDDDRLEIALYEVMPAGSVPAADAAAHAPDAITVGFVNFTLDDKGAARVRKRDTKGTRDMGRCRYADYKGPDRAVLAIEWWGESTEVAVGVTLHEDDLLILPGS